MTINSLLTDGFRIFMQKRVPKGVKMALNGEGVTSEDRTSMKLYSKT